MKKERIGFGITYRITLSMIAVAIIPLTVIWLFYYQDTAERLTNNANERLSLISDHLTSAVDGWVDMNRRMLLQNAQTADIRSMEAERQNAILRSISEQYPWTYLAFTVAPNGQNIGRSDGKPLKFYGDRSYVQQVIRGADLGQQVLVGKTSKKPALVLSSRIRGDESAIGGVLAIAMTIEDISNWITQTKIGETGSAFLLDSEGKVIAHQSKEYTTERRNLSSHPAFRAMKSGKPMTQYQTDNREKLAQIRLTNEGWTLVVEQERAEVFAALDRANQVAMILLVVTFVVVLVFAAFLARQLSAPIIRLTHAADEISMGNLSVSIVERTRKDEIGMLAAAIDRLRDAMELALDKLKKARQTARSAQPHE